MKRLEGRAVPEKPFKLALISNNAFSLYNFRGDLIQDLVFEGVKVYALAPDYDPNMKLKIAGLGALPVDYRLNRAALSFIDDLQSCFSLFKTLRRIRPDITLSYFMKPVIYGSIVAALVGVKQRYALVEGLGFVYQDGVHKTAKMRFVRAIADRLYSLAFSLSAKVFFLNEQDIDTFADGGLIKRAKAVNLHGIGVNVDKLQIAAPVTDPVVFLLMARLLRQKGIGEYANAARIVKRENPQTRFILLGGTDPNPDSLTETEVQAWVDEGIIEWPGKVADVTGYIRESSVYVLPSYYREGVPRSTQEAMAMGRPVITTDNVGCRETVIDGVTGYLVPVRDTPALAAAMMKFVTNPETIVVMGQESRKLAERRFDVRAINNNILGAMGLIAS